jgi:hypothetical protein
MDIFNLARPLAALGLYFVHCHLPAVEHLTRKMALPLPQGLVPSEVAFLCEMELVTVVPRQRLESIELLSVGQLCPAPITIAWFFSL